MKTFFQGICKNVIRNKKALEARYAKRVILMEPVHIQSKEPYNHAEHLSHERAQSLKELFRGVLDRMGNPCKKSLIMKMQGFKDVEIADKLEFSHGGIRKRLSKCRQALRELVLQDESLMNEIDFLK
ncbi:MAG: RNA polymerase sigma factor [Bacteroidia bacterium]